MNAFRAFPHVSLGLPLCNRQWSKTRLCQIVIKWNRVKPPKHKTRKNEVTNKSVPQCRFTATFKRSLLLCVYMVPTHLRRQKHTDRAKSTTQRGDNLFFLVDWFSLLFTRDSQTYRGTAKKGEKKSTLRGVVRGEKKKDQRAQVWTIYPGFTVHDPNGSVVE